MIEQHLYKDKSAAPPAVVIEGVYKALKNATIARTAQVGGVFNNKLYIFGGSHTLLNNVMETYDLDTGEWSTLTTTGAPTPRHSAAGCVLNGKLYVFGGSTTAAWAPTTEAYVFDLATNVWTKLANMPVALCLQSAVVIKSKIYLFAGFNGSSSINNFFEYDPAANTYRSIAHNQPGQHGHKTVAINDRMYLVGGVATTTILSRCVSYDPVSNTWATHASSPLGNTYTFTAALDGYLYMFGGSRNTDTTTHNNLYRYHTATDTWDVLPTGATPMYFGIMIALPDRLLLQGGRNATTLFSTLWEIT